MANPVMKSYGTFAWEDHYEPVCKYHISAVASVRDPECLSRVPVTVFFHPGSCNAFECSYTFSFFLFDSCSRAAKSAITLQGFVQESTQNTLLTCTVRFFSTETVSFHCGVRLVHQLRAGHRGKWTNDRGDF